VHFQNKTKTNSFHPSAIAKAVASITVLMSSHGALAQQPPESYSDIPTINVREVISTQVRLAAGAATNLTIEEIRDYRPLTLHDALDFVPGVFTIDDDALGRRSGIGVRGASARRSRKVLLLEDGSPINSSTYLDSSTHYTPPMDRLERVEVLRGNGMIIHGPLNNHAVINFRNKLATETPQTTFELAAGDLNTNKRHIMHTRTQGDVGIVLAYTGMNGDGIFDTETTQFDDLYGSAQWQINQRHELGTSLTYFRERSDYDESNLTPVEFAAAPRQKLGRFGQEFNTIAIDYMKFDLTHDWQISEGFSMSTKVFSTDLDRPRFTIDPESILVGALPNFVYEDDGDRFIPGDQGVMVSRDRHYRTAGIETRVEKRDIMIGELSHSLQWGLRVERHTLDDNRSEGAQGEILTEGNRGQTTRNEEYIAEAGSFFIQDLIRFGDWTITPGLRGEYFTQSKERRAIALDPGPHDPLLRDHNDVLLPGISVHYDGVRGTELFGSIQRGYSPAMARTASGFPLIPEIGVNTQLGLRSTALAGLKTEASVFYSHLKNTIVQLPITLGDGDSVVINSGGSHSYGFDMGLRYDTAPTADQAINWFTQMAFTYTETSFDGGVIDGNRVPEIPAIVGSLSIGFQHRMGFEASATLSYVGDFYTDPANTENLLLADEDLEIVGANDFLEIREPVVLGRVPSHTLLSARASYTPPERSNMTFWLQGRNLLDRLYVSDLANGMRPGAERSLLAGLTVRF
jgi:Fe(3+) dicitrate transport protein